MNEARENVTYIRLLDGTEVKAPPEFDSQKPDPAIIAKLEAEHAKAKGTKEPPK